MTVNTNYTGRNSNVQGGGSVDNRTAFMPPTRAASNTAASSQGNAARLWEHSVGGANARARVLSQPVNAPRYDGSTPAPGTTNTNGWIPTNPPVKGDPARRNAADYDNVINQFAVAHNPRYTPRGGNTYCNIFVWDVTRAMGAEIPHWVDANGTPVGVGQGRELNANATNDWLNQHGAQHGWRQVSAEEAQRMANAGHPSVASWKNPGGIGHIAMVRPGEINSRGPAIAQAGSTNTNNAHVRDTFGNRPVQYWVNDTGRATTNPSPSPAPSPTPTPSPRPVPSPLPPSRIPGVDLRRGDTGVEVGKLQASLVKLGYMTQAQVNTGPGTFGPRTFAALRNFQRDHGVPDTGFYGPLTRAALQKTVTAPPQGLSRGDSGANVRQLQDALVRLGYMTRTQVNTGIGIFGPRTFAAVREFQRDHNVPTTGYYGPLTHAALTRALGGAQTPGNNPLPTTNPPQTPPVTNPPSAPPSSQTAARVIAAVPANLRSYAEQSVPLILEEARKAGLTPAQTAYVLGTVQHESLMGKAMTEYASGEAYEGRADLGNTQAGDGVRFKGRGFVQLTGRNNYRDWSNRLGIDLVGNPELAARPDIAAKILVIGMRDGTFTGRKLSTYINSSQQDFVNARRVVNGTDRADLIAGYARNYLDALR